MNRCRPPSFATVSSPGRRCRCSVLARIIVEPTSPTSRGSTPLMDPRVPTGMKAGVVTSPWGVVNTPVRARRAPSSPGVVPVTRKPKGPCELWIVSVTCRGQPLESGAGVVVAEDAGCAPSLTGEVAQRLLAEADPVAAAAAWTVRPSAPIGRPGRGRVVTMADPLRTPYPVAARRSSSRSTRSTPSGPATCTSSQRPARSTRAGARRVTGPPRSRASPARSRSPGSSRAIHPKGRVAAGAPFACSAAARVAHGRQRTPVGPAAPSSRTSSAKTSAKFAVWWPQEAW